MFDHSGEKGWQAGKEDGKGWGRAPKLAENRNGAVLEAKRLLRKQCTDANYDLGKEKWLTFERGTSSLGKD